MPTVVLSNGERVRFPADMSRNQIERELQRMFQPQQAGAGDVVRGAGAFATRQGAQSANPFTTQVTQEALQGRAPPPARRQTQLEAAGRGLVDAASLGAADEIAGGTARALVDPGGGLVSIGRGMQQAMGGFSPTGGVLSSIGAAYGLLRPSTAAQRTQGQAAQQAVQGTMRRDLEQSYEQHPFSTMGGALVGSAPMGAIGTGARAMNLGRRVAAGAGVGGATGAVYGYNTGTDPESRMRGAVQTGAMGAGFGAALPAAITGATTTARNIGRISNPVLRAGAGAAALGAPVAAGIGAFDAFTGLNLALDDARIEVRRAERRLQELTDAGAPPEELAAVRDYIRNKNASIQQQESVRNNIVGGAAIAGGALAAGSRLRVDPRRLGMFGGNVVNRPPLTAEEQAQAAETLATLALRTGRPENELLSAFTEAAGQRRGAIAANVLGQQAETRLARLARMPGETGESARRTLAQRGMGNYERIGQRITGDIERDPLQVVNERVRVASQQRLAPLFGEAPYEARDQASRVLTQLEENPEFARALPVAREMVRGLTTLTDNPLPRSAIDDPLYLLHYAKIALQAELQQSGVLRNSLSQIDATVAQSAVNRIRDALDNAMPGYKSALRDIEEEMLPRTVVQTMSGVRRPERANLAARGLGAPGVTRAAREGRAADLVRVLREEDELYQRLQRISPDTGSQTFPLMADVADDFAMQQGRVNLSPNAILNAFVDRITSPLAEGRRNVMGRALLTPVDPGLEGYDPETIAQIRRALEREFARRRQASRTALSGAATSYGWTPETE